jgi:hypothetical protein
VAWIVLGMLGCPTPVVGPAPPGGWANVAPARVDEVLRADGRLYLRVTEGQWEFWVAVAPMAVDVGDHVLMGKGPERKRFLSADLARRFDVMTFIDDISTATLAQSWAAIHLPVPAGGTAIGEVFTKRDTLAGESIIVRGRVVKANKGIFDTNWYHLVDGTGSEGQDDLTVTSSADAAVGDVVRVEGVLTTDKDLGFGYFYAAIIEDAALVVESSTGS